MTQREKLLIYAAIGIGTLMSEGYFHEKTSLKAEDDETQAALRAIHDWMNNLGRRLFTVRLWELEGPTYPEVAKELNDLLALFFEEDGRPRAYS